MLSMFWIYCTILWLLAAQIGIATDISEPPTADPTLDPTLSPTFAPTASPTRSPTQDPSVAPTKVPTFAPSTAPTHIPTCSPTFSPTEVPSFIPTKFPTSQPSSQPTRNPTSQPSSRPSNQPSSSPTQPTSCPSTQPTTQPSTTPSNAPSTHPSAFPSMQPTSQPTSSPTCPTSQPTEEPSSQPTKVPSAQPSMQPSAEPSAQPTSLPSGIPSTQPSRVPTTQPTSFPSSQPSVQPSMVPSGQPSSLPSAQPSIQPSACPSTQPSSQPSSMPTNPTSQPTCRPSSQPSRQPSRQPSAQPTSNPSMHPDCPVGSKYVLLGHTTVFNNTKTGYSRCEVCPGGFYSDSTRSSRCKSCAAGRYSSSGSATCNLCDFNTYASKANSTKCTRCGAFNVNGILGSQSKNDCINPMINFAIGSFCVVVSIFAVVIYLCIGQLHHVAFRRKYRLIRKSMMLYGLVLTTTDMVTSAGTILDTIRFGNRDETMMQLFIRKIVKPFIVFPLLCFAIICVITSGQVAKSLFKIIFNAMVIWRAYYKLDILSDFKVYYEDFINSLEAVVDTAFFRTILGPFVYLFQQISSINIDLSSVKVTCPGAQSPVYFLTNIMVVAVVVIVIESDVHVLWSTMIIPAFQKIRILLFNRYYIQNNLLSTLSYFAGAMVLLQLPDPGKWVQYAMGFAVVSKFFTYDGGYWVPRSVNCDGAIKYSTTVNGHEVRKSFPMDTILANLGGLLVVLTLPTVVYMISQVLFVQQDTDDVIGKYFATMKKNVGLKLDQNPSVARSVTVLRGFLASMDSMYLTGVAFLRRFTGHILSGSKKCLHRWQRYIFQQCSSLGSAKVYAASSSEEEPAFAETATCETLPHADAIVVDAAVPAHRPGLPSLLLQIPENDNNEGENEEKDDEGKEQFPITSHHSRRQLLQTQPSFRSKATADQDLRFLYVDDMRTVLCCHPKRTIPEALLLEEDGPLFEEGATRSEVTKVVNQMREPGISVSFKDPETQLQRLLRHIFTVFSFDWLLMKYLYTLGMKLYERQKTFLSNKYMIDYEYKAVRDANNVVINSISIYVDAFEIDERLSVLRRYVNLARLPKLPWFDGFVNVDDADTLRDHREEAYEWNRVNKEIPTYYDLIVTAREEMKFIDEHLPFAHWYMSLFVPTQLLLSKTARKQWYRVGKTFFGMFLASIGIWTQWLVDDFQVMNKFKQYTDMNNLIYSRIGSDVFNGQQEDAFTKIDNNSRVAFGEFIAALMVCRIALLQIYPRFTIWATLAIATASTPMLVWSKEMDDMLPRMFAVRPLERAYALLREDNGGNEPFFLQAYFLGYYIFITQSRFIMFVMNAYECVFTIGVIFFGKETLQRMVPPLLLIIVQQSLLSSGYLILLLKKLLFPNTASDSDPLARAMENALSNKKRKKTNDHEAISDDNASKHLTVDIEMTESFRTSSALPPSPSSPIRSVDKRMRLQKQLWSSSDESVSSKSFVSPEVTMRTSGSDMNVNNDNPNNASRKHHHPFSFNSFSMSRDDTTNTVNGEAGNLSGIEVAPIVFTPPPIPRHGRVAQQQQVSPTAAAVPSSSSALSATTSTTITSVSSPSKPSKWMETNVSLPLTRSFVKAPINQGDIVDNTNLNLPASSGNHSPVSSKSSFRF